MKNFKNLKNIISGTIAVMFLSASVTYDVFADESANDTLESSNYGVKSDNNADKSIIGNGSRIKVLMYNESDVYVIRTKYGYQTNIVFDPKEEIETISVGDRSLWQLIPAGNRLYIRPLNEDMKTNMTLITNKHSYEFDLKSVSKNSNSNIYVAKFIYPDKNSVASNNFDNVAIPSVSVIKEEANVLKLPEEQSNDSLDAKVKPSKSSKKSKKGNIKKISKKSVDDSVVVSERLQLKPADAASASPTLGFSSVARNNYSYVYEGDDAIAPLKVYDDGESTFIKYRAIGSEAPEVVAVDSEGKEMHIKAVVKNSDLVVDGVLPEMIVRTKAGDVKIFNESLNRR